MSPICVETVKRAVEDNIDLKVEGMGSTLNVLRALREDGQLSPQQALELKELEKGIDLSAQALFKTLALAFGSDSASIDKGTICARLGMLSTGTLCTLVDKVCPHEAVAMKKDLVGPDQLRADVLNRLTDGVREKFANTSQLIDILEIVTLDPLCANARQFLDTARELLDQVVDQAKKLFTDTTRKHLAPRVSRTDESATPQTRLNNHDELEARSRRGVKDVGAGVSATQGELGAIGRHTAVERALHELQTRLLALNDRIDQARGVLSSTPAAQSFETGVKLHQDEREADGVRGKIADLERAEGVV